MSGHDDEIHVLPVRYYVYNILALLFLLIITVYASFVHIGDTINVVIMLSIAIAKMALVILIFMHVLWSSKLTQVFALTAFVWLLFMFGLTFADYVTRLPSSQLKEQVQASVHHDEHHEGDHSEAHAEEAEAH